MGQFRILPLSYENSHFLSVNSAYFAVFTAKYAYGEFSWVWVCHRGCIIVGEASWVYQDDAPGTIPLERRPRKDAPGYQGVGG